MEEKEIVRKFEGGAVRDLDKDKYDYEGFLNPMVLEAYAAYMHKNRFLKDGTVRNSDNWQAHFGPTHKSICMKSLLRHVHDLWMFERGYQGRDEIDDAINGILFNTMAYYKKVLDERNEEKTKGMAYMSPEENKKYTSDISKENLGEKESVLDYYSCSN